MEKKHNISTNEAEKKYPGVDIDKSDDEKVTPKMVKQETKELNNNPLPTTILISDFPISINNLHSPPR